MSGLRVGLAPIVVTFCALAAATTAAGASGCAATVSDGFGPFGRGSPPVRASIGKGHVLAGAQSDAKGRYTRALSATVLTDRNGRFRFEGPYPASYEGRPPHIHLRVVASGHEILLSRYEPARGARRGSVRLVLVPQAV